MFEESLRGWGGEEVVVRFDGPSGAWMLIGVHSTVLGPAMGGARLKPYATVDDALIDVLRLSGAMTMKQAAADLPYGGGKAVIAVPEVPPPGSEERRALLLRYGDLVSSLGGTYVTAADMNTGPPDMDVIGERCRYVLGRSREAGGSGNPGEGTATGVFHGIVASARHGLGTEDLGGKTVLVQGLGSVGRRLAQRLAETGATLLLADLDEVRAKELAERLAATAVPSEKVISTPCDVFAPCATGGILSAESIPRLACTIVAGAANNQLAATDDAQRLRDAGILYAPDYVINAGGVIHLAGYETLGWDDSRMARRLAGIGITLAEIFEAADAEGITTDEVAARMANERIAAARLGDREAAAPSG